MYIIVAIFTKKQKSFIRDLIIKANNPKISKKIFENY